MKDLNPTGWTEKRLEEFLGASIRRGAVANGTGRREGGGEGEGNSLG